MQETNLDSKVVDRLLLLCWLACHPMIFSFLNKKNKNNTNDRTTQSNNFGEQRDINEACFLTFPAFKHYSSDTCKIILSLSLLDNDVFFSWIMMFGRLLMPLTLS